MLHLVGSSVLLYLVDDARLNKNQTEKYIYVCFKLYIFWKQTKDKEIWAEQWQVFPVIGLFLISSRMQSLSRRSPVFEVRKIFKFFYYFYVTSLSYVICTKYQYAEYLNSLRIYF